MGNRIDKSTAFNSGRLEYRGIQESDARAISEWRSDPDNYRWFFDPHPVSVDEHLAWFVDYLRDQSRLDLLILDERGVPIGTGSLSNIHEGSCEISYMIGDKNARRKGYAAEAIRALSDFAFSSLDLEQVYARILPSNEASIRAIRRGGFVENERIFKLSKTDLVPNE